MARFPSTERDYGASRSHRPGVGAVSTMPLGPTRPALPSPLVPGRTWALPEVVPVARWFIRDGTVPAIIRPQTRRWLDGFVGFRLARRLSSWDRGEAPPRRRSLTEIERLLGAWDVVDPWVAETLSPPDHAKDAQRRARRATAALATHALAARRRRLGPRRSSLYPPPPREGTGEAGPLAWDDTIPDAWVLRVL